MSWLYLVIHPPITNKIITPQPIHSFLTSRLPKIFTKPGLGSLFIQTCWAQLHNCSITFKIHLRFTHITHLLTPVLTLPVPTCPYLLHTLLSGNFFTSEIADRLAFQTCFLLHIFSLYIYLLIYTLKKAMFSLEHIHPHYLSSHIILNKFNPIKLSCYTKKIWQNGNEYELPYPFKFCFLVLFLPSLISKEESSNTLGQENWSRNK